jgi:uncharacterized protein
MALFEQINDDINTAMKAREKEKLQALRNIKKVMIEAKSVAGADDVLSDEAVIKIISKLAKQGNDSAAIYKQQNREDLYEQEMVQVAVFEEYLPEKLSDEELSSIVKAIIDKTGATSMKDMGKVMGMASKELAGKADGKDISTKVRSLLQ